MDGALQTRKWTGNDGVEKYSTEIVLQGFNSTLTMLDGRGEGGGYGGGSGGSDNGDPGYGGGSDSGGGSAGGSDNGGGGNAPSGDLDDKIPF